MMTSLQSEDNMNNDDDFDDYDTDNDDEHGDDDDDEGGDFVNQEMDGDVVDDMGDPDLAQNGRYVLRIGVAVAPHWKFLIFKCF